MRMKMNCVKTSLAFVAVALFGLTVANASNGTWYSTNSVAGNAFWTNSWNWSVQPYPAGNQTATFINSGNGRTMIDLAGLSFGVSNIVFDSASVAAYSLGSGGANQQALVFTNNSTLRVGATVLESQRVDATVLLGHDRASSTHTFRNDQSLGTLTLAGNVTATNSGGTAGTKNLNLAGNGAITISGNISLGGASALTLTSSNLGLTTLSGSNRVTTVTSAGGPMSLSGTNNIDLLNLNTASLLTFSGTNILARLDLNGSSTLPALITLSAGSSLSLTNGGGQMIAAYQDAVINGPGSISLLPCTTGDPTGNNLVASGKTLTINAPITGPNSLEFWSGTGTYVLNGINDFFGIVNMGPAGTLSVAKIGNKGSTTSNLGRGTYVSLNANGTRLLYTGTGETADRTIALNASVILDNSGSGHLKLTAPVTVSSGAKTLTLQGSTASTAEFSGLLGNDQGTLSLVKSGTGTWLLSTNNTYTGTTTVNGGTLSLVGVNGSLASSTGYILAGGTLLLDNTATANNANRLRDASAITLNGGTLNFSSTGGSVDYSENAGALTVNQNASTIATAQADVGQTSTLRFASLSRNAGGTVNFAGTGLGVDSRNRIFITTGMAEGLIGPWATVNGTHLAAYSAANGVYASDDAAVFTDIAARGPSTIVSNDASFVRINLPGEDGPIELDSEVTRVTTLIQNTETAATVNTLDKTLQTAAITVSEAKAAVTIGSAANDGTLSPLLPNGELSLNNASASPLTVNAVLADTGASSLLTKYGTGAAILTASNTFAGTVSVFGGSLVLANSNALQYVSLGTAGTVFDSSVASHAFTLGGLTGSFIAPLADNAANAVALTVGKNNANTTFSGSLTGSGSLTKAGNGTLTLSGTNSFTGGLTVNASAGAVTASAVGALGLGPVANNATLNLTAGAVAYSGLSTSLSGAGTVNVTLSTGGNTTTLNGDYSGFSGLWNIGVGAAMAAGKAQMNGPDNSAAMLIVRTNATVFCAAAVTHNAALTLQGGDTGESYGQLRLESNAHWAGPVTLAAPVTNSADAFFGCNSGVGIVSGLINDLGAGYTVDKVGGGTIIFYGANPYLGPTWIKGGVLSVPTLGNVGGGAGPLGAPTSAAQGTVKLGLLGTGGTLQYTGMGETSDRVIELAGTTATATIDHSGTNRLVLSSDMLSSLAGNKQLRLQGSTIGTGVVAGVISDNGTTSSNNLFKTGSGTWILAANNTFKGNIVVDNGGLVATKSESFGNWPKTISAANNVNGADPHINLDGKEGNLVIPATITFRTSSTRAGAIHNDAGTNTILGALNLIGGDGSTHLYSDAGKLTLSGPVFPPTDTNRELHLRGNGDGEISGVIANGATVNMPVYKEAGLGTWTFSGANTYGGITYVTAGTLILSGLNGAIAAGTTIGSGATLTLENSPEANNVNRLSDLGANTMNGGVLSFAHSGGAADYSERTGQLLISQSSNRVVTSQADVGQTSAVTFASLTRTAPATVNFVGTGLGLDERNQIRFDTVPTLVNGAIGPWAMVNNTELAGYGTYGVTALTSYNDLAARGPASVIPDNTSLNNRINLPGEEGFVTLETSPVSSMNTLLQNTETASVVTTTNTLLRTSGILIGAGKASLTIGAAEGDGALASLAGGNELTLANHSAIATLTINAPITNTTLALNKLGVGTVLLTGSNSFAGATVIFDGSLELGGGSTQTLAGVISGAGSLVKSGDGKLTLSGANTLTGPTIIKQGVVVAQNSVAFGNASTGTVVESGATLDLGGTLAKDALSIGPENLTVSGTGVNGMGAIVNNGGADQQNAISKVTLSGNTTIGGARRFDIRNSTPALTMNGYTLTKISTNFINVTAINVSPDGEGGTGAIDVQGGTFSLDNAVKFNGSSANTLTVRNGAFMQLYNVATNNPLLWSLTLEQNASLYPGAGAGLGAVNVWSGPVTLNGAALLAGTGNSVTFSGPIGGSGSLIKTAGASTFYLTGTNTYSGTTAVSNGTLYAKTAGSLPGVGTSRVTVTGGGTLMIPTGDGVETGWTYDQLRALLYDTDTFNTNTATLGIDTSLASLDHTGDLTKPMALLKQGPNTLTLSGVNTFRGALTVNGGVLDVAGAANHAVGSVTIGNASMMLTNATPQYFSIVSNSTAIVGNGASDFGRLTLAGNAAWSSYLQGYNSGASVLYVGYNGRGVLLVQDNATLTNRLILGNATGSHGAIYQRGNSVVHNWGGSSSDTRLGASGYGYYELSSGTLTNNGYTQMAQGLNGIGILSQFGGTLRQGSVYGGDLSISRGGTGVVYLAGGTFASSVGMTVGAISDNAGARGFADLTMAGSASALVSGVINMADRTNMFAVVNLNGGTLTANQFSKGNRTGSLALVNFNGGSFRSRTSGNLFNTGVNTPDLVNIYPGGATFDIPATNSCTIPVSLRAPAGYGVSGIAVTPRNGYIGPPFVSITGGGGTGATAIAQFDSANGTVTGVTMTSPGYGYRGTPTVTLAGGGTNLQTAVTGVTLAPNTSGGLTKIGAGILTLSGTNTYAGATTVSNGTLRLGVANALPTNAAVVVAGGVYDLNGLSVTNGSILVTSGTVINGALNGGTLIKVGEAVATQSVFVASASPIVIAGGTLQLAVQPGLYEGRVAGSFDVTAPNPQTATKLSATNAYLNFVSPVATTSGGIWVDNSTYIYTGYLWNSATTNENWTFNKYFDDSVLLKIDNATVINNAVSSTNLITSYTMTPGPHPIELRLGQGTGTVGFGGGYPGVGFDRLGRNTRNAAFFQRLADPGDGSLLTLSLLNGANRTDMFAPGSTVEVAVGATLNLGGTTQTLAGLSGSGTVTNGTLAVTGVIAPGGTNVIGTLTVATSATLSGSLLVDVSSSGTSDLLAVQGSVTLAELALQIANPDQLDRTKQYTIMTCTGSRNGTFSSSNFPDSRWHVSYRSDGTVKLVFVTGTTLLLK